ncbi:hypothetical protein SAMN04244548_04703 [Paracoccus pantotrophus]|nr:hypothetical protein SAMN04244548_04703 [Paracoccus pantotrophus]
MSRLAAAAYSVPGGLVPDRLRVFLAAIPPERIAGVELAEFEMPGTAQGGHRDHPGHRRSAASRRAMSLG